jgi:hypothetical protein|tara:strand:- start:98 stop:472 length:375 start_codon:yes stop_codon:yes gene_type:complete
MANTFIRKTSKNIGTSYFQVGANSAGASQTGAYTVGSNTQATVIGLSVSNVTGSAVDIDISLSATMANTTNDVSLGSSIPLPSGSTVILVGGDQKLVLATADLIKVKSSAATSLDVVMSVLEIT